MLHGAIVDNSGPFEMLSRYGKLLSEQGAWTLPCFALAMVVTVSVVPAQHQRRVHMLATVAALLAGLAYAWQLRWLCDDAFISFRYAERLVRGEGLVFNVGERVEGYTNFLWTVLLAGLVKLGADIGQASIVIGLGCYGALIVLTSRMARDLATPDAPLAIPLAVLWCGAQYSLASFATSGLETMFGALLAALALERALHQRWFASGLAGVLAAMTHPDHGILYAALGLCIVTHRPSRRGIVRYAAPFVLIYIPYFVWRVQYYGELFPNTYYAKSAGETYFRQGGAYLGAFFLSSGLWAALPLAICGVIRTRATLLGRYVMIATPLFCLYVAKVGGDFMHGRLLCVLVVPLLLVIEAGARRLVSQQGHLAWVSITIAAAMLVLVPIRLFGTQEKKWHIADERTFYPLTSFSPILVGGSASEWAEDLTKFWKPYGGLPILGVDCVGIVGYYTGFPIVDGYGLTDRAVAHKTIAQRGRPGHEKKASPAYYASRDVDLSDMQVYPAPYDALTAVRLHRTKLHLVHYDPEVIAPLRNHPTARFVDFEQHLAEQLKRSAATPEAAACDAWFAQEYFFSQAPRSKYRSRSMRRLLDAGRPAYPTGSADYTALYRFETTHEPDRSTALTFDVEQKARYAARGDAFTSFPMLGAVPGQDTILGHAGGMVNTFTERKLDGAVGRLETQPFTLVGDLLEIWVGGGAHSDKLRVSLIVDGKRQFSSGGCNSEMMGRRLWQIAELKGRQAVLEIVDSGRSPWGHISVDSAVQWVPKTRDWMTMR